MERQRKKYDASTRERRGPYRLRGAQKKAHGTQIKAGYKIRTAISLDPLVFAEVSEIAQVADVSLSRLLASIVDDWLAGFSIDNPIEPNQGG